jgi:hypothetical protein
MTVAQTQGLHESQSRRSDDSHLKNSIRQDSLHVNASAFQQTRESVWSLPEFTGTTVLHDLQPSLLCTAMCVVGSGHLEDFTVYHVQPSYGVSRLHDILYFIQRCIRDLSRGQRNKAPFSMARVGGRCIYKTGSRGDGIVVLRKKPASK